MATLDDILTTQKNGVIGINNISKINGYLGGQITSATIPYSAGTTSIYSGAGRLVNYVVTVPGTTISVTGASWSAGTATISHSGTTFSVGAVVTLTGISPAGYNGTYAITGASSGQIQYAIASNPGVYVSGGSLSVNGSIYNAPTSTSVLITPNNILVSVPAGIAVTPVGVHFSNGLVVVPGLGQSINLTYSVD